MRKIFLICFVFSTVFSFAQEITGRTRTNDKYSNSLKTMTEQYLKNDFTLFDELYADDAILNVNGEVSTKTEIMQGFSMHHMLYEDIAMPSFIETTFYDENNNNSVWSHQWGWWQGTSKNSGSRDEPNPLNASFKWVDGKIVQASWIYDPTDLNEEIKTVSNK